jgi:outer membrane protein assembly factor BamE
MSRNHLVLLLLLSMLSACSSVKLGGIGPHRIDVQQGNALDQESVAKLKPGLNRSQVRFLLGTPLLVDPFHNNRWDYVYVSYKGGKLAEQKRITLFFDNDILQRIEGDVPATEPVAAQGVAPPLPMPAAATSSAVAPRVESVPLEAVKKPQPVTDAMLAKSTAALAETTPLPATAAVVPISPPSEPKAPASRPVAVTVPVATTVVPPLSASKTPFVSAAPRAADDLQLHAETNVAQIQPDVIPPFPDPKTPPVASATEASVLRALKVWSDAWLQGNANVYIAAYAADFVPAGGDTHTAWEKRRRSLLGVAKNVELRIESPKVKMTADGQALVTFNQYYRSTNYRDDLVKQIRLAQREGRWVIVDEHVVSTLQAPKL